MSLSGELPASRWRWAVGFLAALVMSSGVVLASPARADEPGETTVGYVLVQQALGHLAHDSTSEGVMLALEKVDDALSTEDQEGIDVAELQRAESAIEEGDIQQGRVLLQSSIADAVSELEPAVGEETGTTIVLEPLEGRGALTVGDWVLLLSSILLVLAGGALAWYFKPRDNVHALRDRLGPPHPASAADPQHTATKDSR